MILTEIKEKLGYIPRELERFLIKLNDEKEDFEARKYLEENIGIVIDTHREDFYPDNFYPFATRCFIKDRMHTVGFLKKEDSDGAIYIEYVLYNKNDKTITNKYQSFSQLLKDLIVINYQHTVEFNVNNWECWYPLQKYFGEPITADQLYTFTKPEIEEIYR